MFLFRHAFSEVSRPIAVKFCHIIGDWALYSTSPKIGGPHTQKIGGQKRAKFRAIFYNFQIFFQTLIANISLEIGQSLLEHTQVGTGVPKNTA